MDGWMDGWMDGGAGEFKDIESCPCSEAPKEREAVNEWNGYERQKYR
jgi:hypothetical protein